MYIDIVPNRTSPLAVLLRVATREGKKTHKRTLANLSHWSPEQVETLAEWLRRFIAARERALSLGFDEAFIRKWTYYLAYCEAGFRAGAVGDAHVFLTQTGETAA